MSFLAFSSERYRLGTGTRKNFSAPSKSACRRSSFDVWWEDREETGYGQGTGLSEKTRTPRASQYLSLHKTMSVALKINSEKFVWLISYCFYSTKIKGENLCIKVWRSYKFYRFKRAEILNIPSGLSWICYFLNNKILNIFDILLQCWNCFKNLSFLFFAMVAFLFSYRTGGIFYL